MVFKAMNSSSVLNSNMLPILHTEWKDKMLVWFIFYPVNQIFYKTFNKCHVVQFQMIKIRLLHINPHFVQLFPFECRHSGILKIRFAKHFDFSSSFVIIWFSPGLDSQQGGASPTSHFQVGQAAFAVRDHS